MFNNHPISYAQNREDILLQAFFDPDEVGFYVDIGAYDPDVDSVTRHFYLEGWHGINVEPQLNRLKLFKEKRSRDVNVNCGIADKEGELTLLSYENQGLSNFSNEIKKSYSEEAGVGKYKDITVPVITLKKLFLDNNVTSIQFLKVDVEGFEYEVLEGNDWKKYRPEVICIEANHIKKDWKSLLAIHNYSLMFFDGVNDYYTDNKTSRAAKFNYVESVVFKEPIIHYGLLNDLMRYEEHIIWLEKTIDSARVQAELQNEQLLAVRTELDEVISLKRHIKKSVRVRLSRVDRKINRMLSGQIVHKPEKIDATSNDDIKITKQSIESAIEYDKNNFLAYSKASKPSPLLPIYQASRNKSVKILRNVKAQTKRNDK